MLEDIKKMQGISHNEFDSIINDYIQAGLLDLKSIGIVNSKLTSSDFLIRTAIITFVLSNLDVNNSEMYYNSYMMQKDKLRHLREYIG